MPVFHTDRLMLRHLELNDAETLEKLINDYDIASTTLNIPYPYPVGGAESFINSRAEIAERGDGYTFAITNKVNHAFMGCIGIQINQPNNRGELGYWLGTCYWNQGFITEAATRVVQFGFEELALNKIVAGAMTKNPASSNVMKKIGMQYEGLFRQQFLKWDSYEDIIYYSMLREEYFK